MWSAGEADDKQRFLADLRALRDAAALEWDELAARAHYPSDVLKEAENGPSLPSLPILAAYVRACEGDVPEWEERWRRLGVESYADPGLPVRPAGASPAAVAGARAGVSVVPPDAYDPERIKAALRSSHGRSDRGARGTASQATSALVEPEANGNHYASRAEEGPFHTAVVEVPDVTQADAVRRDPFAADWLAEGEPTSPPDAEPEAEPAPDASDDWFTPRQTADPEQTWSTAGPDSSADDTDTWFTPRERTDGGLARPERDLVPPQDPAGPTVTGFWTPSVAASAPAEVQRPAAPAAPKLTIPRATWPAPAETPADDTPGPTDRATSVLARAAAAAPSLTMAGPAVPPGPVIPPSERRSDRLYPVRLLVIIVVAALIGSVLVLLLR